MKNVVAIGVALAAALLIVFLVFAPRTKSGSEFCPQTFEMRTFSYKANLLQSYQMDRSVPSVMVGGGISKHLQAFDATVSQSDGIWWKAATSIRRLAMQRS